ncbi:MAG: AmmeMemoRadiSam system protein A [Steroidobacteraceae bacterium]
MPSTELSARAQQQLIELARRSIEEALDQGVHTSLAVPLDDELSAPGASFVTLRERDTQSLRGCCGSIEARLPLAEDVWRNARASAFADPRFPSLTRREWPNIELYISVLSAPTPFAVASEAELLSTLRPGIDGLVLEYGSHRATFLPAVWEQLREPEEFTRHLRAKAGLPPEFWSSQLQWSRYTVQELGSATSAA